jgi:hypothetical protein
MAISNENIWGIRDAHRKKKNSRTVLDKKEASKSVMKINLQNPGY